MQKAGAGSLDKEQTQYRTQLHLAVENINEADELLTLNKTDAVSHRATALALTALARILVVENAEKSGMLTRLPNFKRTPHSV
jgi:hypothetical protein